MTDEKNGNGDNGEGNGNLPVPSGPVEVGFTEATIENLVRAGKDLISETNRPLIERIQAEKEIAIGAQDIERQKISFDREERARASKKEWFLLGSLVVAAAYMYLIEQKLDALLIVTHGLAFGFGFMTERRKPNR